MSQASFAELYEIDSELWKKEPEPVEKRPLIWLRDSKIPVEDPYGAAKFLTVDEQEHLKTEHIFHAEWFDLTNLDDLEKFREVWQRVTDGWYDILGEETFVVDGKSLKFLRYIETYQSVPSWLYQNMGNDLPLSQLS
jgi:hypothetical protein